MAKFGRNEACPCGSGAKYKRCCEALHERGVSAWYADHSGECHCAEVEELSHHAGDLIEAGDLDQAETICRTLQRDFPAQVDGFDLLAAVYAGRGHTQDAVRQYRIAAAFARVVPSSDAEFADWLTEQANLLERLAPHEHGGEVCPTCKRKVLARHTAHP